MGVNNCTLCGETLKLVGERTIGRSKYKLLRCEKCNRQIARIVD